MPSEPERLAQVRRLLDDILPANAFYAAKFGTPSLQTWADFTALPFTTKAELLGGAHHTLPVGRHTRMHQTSGTTTGRPLRVYDTPASWRSLCECWHANFAGMGFTPADRLAFPVRDGIPVMLEGEARVLGSEPPAPPIFPVPSASDPS